MRFGLVATSLATFAALAQPAAGGARAQSDAAAPESAEDASGASRPKPTRLLPALLDNADYPTAALAKREQGTVGIELAIDRSGKVTGCSVTSSSGSSVLDLTSCQLMRLRAQFKPARDLGEPVAGTFRTAIRWVLPKAGVDSGLELAYREWVDCVSAETAKLAQTKMDLQDITRKSMARCVGSEHKVARLVGSEVFLGPARTSIRRAIATQVFDARRRPVIPAPTPSQNR